MRSMMHWFNQVGPMRMSARPYSGPVSAAAVTKSGGIVPVDYRVYSDRSKVQAIGLDNYLGHVTLIPKPGKWGGEARHPMVPMATIRMSADYDTMEAAVAALIAKVAEVVAAEEAVRADPEVHLARELGRHDWWACYSDSPGVDGAANMHMAEIKAIYAKCDPARAQALWDAACPWPKTEATP